MGCTPPVGKYKFEFGSFFSMGFKHLPMALLITVSTIRISHYCPFNLLNFGESFRSVFMLCVIISSFFLVIMAFKYWEKRIINIITILFKTLHLSWKEPLGMLWERRRKKNSYITQNICHKTCFPYIHFVLLIRWFIVNSPPSFTYSLHQADGYSFPCVFFPLVFELLFISVLCS